MLQQTQPKVNQQASHFYDNLDIASMLMLQQLATKRCTSKTTTKAVLKQPQLPHTAYT